MIPSFNRLCKWIVFLCHGVKGVRNCRLPSLPFQVHCGRWCSYFSLKKKTLHTQSLTLFLHLVLLQQSSCPSFLCNACRCKLPLHSMHHPQEKHPHPPRFDFPIWSLHVTLCVTEEVTALDVSKCVTTQTTKEGNKWLLQHAVKHRGFPELSVVSVYT